MFRRHEPQGPRSADDRARAAAERAARRAAREGRPVEPPPPDAAEPEVAPRTEPPEARAEPEVAPAGPPPAAPSGPPEARVEPEVAPAGPPSAAPSEPHVEHPADAPAAAAAPAAPEVDPPPRAAAGSDNGATARAAAREPEPAEALTAPAAGRRPEPRLDRDPEPEALLHEPPAEIRVRRGGDDAAPAREPQPEPPDTKALRRRWRGNPHALGETRPSAFGRLRGRGYGRRRVASLLALLAIGAALYVINAVFQPFKADGRGSVSVRVPAGASVEQIGDRLQAAEVIDSARFFAINATATFRRGKLRPGRYTLARDMPNGQAIDALVQGPKVTVVKTFRLTIPEGRSRREILPVLEQSSLTGNYLTATSDRAARRRIRRLGAPKGTRTAEGYLFPATYQLVDEAPASELVDRQLDTFRDNFREVGLARAKRAGLTRNDVVIIASMVEREAQVPRERALISAVIWNRLRQGIPLGIDATIRFAENNWSRPLRQSELQKDGPYNTRTRRGLPPTPIGNPGLASLKAAAAPAKASYLYYVVKPETCGEHAFSSTEAKFQRDSRRYEAARRANGGNSPTTCPSE